MARKKLNKKVALLGSGFLAVLVLGIIAVILHLSQDPEKFIQDGDAAFAVKDYKKAADNYHKARNHAETDELKVKMLFKLIDVYLETDEWTFVRGCWDKIIQLDRKNIKARFGRLKYLYILADSGASTVWREVASQVTDLLEIADQNALEAKTSDWESFGSQQTKLPEKLQPYLYLLRGRAVFEMTRLGMVQDAEESLTIATDNLEKVRALQPDSIQAYWYLAQTAIVRGDLRERNAGLEEAEKILEQAVEIATDDPEAYINLLRIKTRYAQDLTGGLGKDTLQLLEAEYLALTQKFSENAEVFSALANFYLLLGPQYQDKALKAAVRSVELDSDNIAYAINAANLHYNIYSITGQASDIEQTIRLVKNALMLPDAQDVSGPRQWANKRNRITLYSFIANCFTEQIINARRQATLTKENEQQWIAEVEVAVHEIEQIFGSGEDPQVIKWRGILDLAKDNINTGVRKLYTAYEQLKASGQDDAQVSYALANTLKDTSEIGAVREFLISALNAGIGRTKPRALLEYVELSLKLNAYSEAVNVLDAYKKLYGDNQRSRELLVRAYVGSNQFEKAEEEFANLTLENSTLSKLKLELLRARVTSLKSAIARKQVEESLGELVIRRKTPEQSQTQVQDSIEMMQAELYRYNQVWTDLINNLLLSEPNQVQEKDIALICENFITNGKISEAQALVDSFLKCFPDNITAQVYQKTLSMPDPSRDNQQVRNQIQKDVILNISDPIMRANEFGLYYFRHDMPDEALKEFKKIADPDSGKEITVPQFLALSYTFDIALAQKKWNLAEKITDLAKQNNIDDCDGAFFTARLFNAKGEYQQALEKIDECLKQKPVFSHAYSLRSSINSAMGDNLTSIQDAQKALSFNPLSNSIARILALALYKRNLKLGTDVTHNQVAEAGTALARAMSLNPTDWRLQSLYAEYISRKSPYDALAIRQRLQKFLPSVENAVLLGKLASEIAEDERQTDRKNVLHDIAHSSFEQALALDPSNRVAINSYDDYLRSVGQKEKAEELVLKSADSELLYIHYFRSGQYEQAREILEQLHSKEPTDSNVVKNLLVVADRTTDIEAAKKYSSQLLKLDDSMDNHLLQIQTFLKMGLVKEAELKLESFKEKHPEEPRALMLEAWLATRQGRLKKGLQLVNRSLETDHGNPIAWRLRGAINSLMANYDQAIFDLKHSRALRDESITRLELAKTYLKMEKEDDAVTELKSVIEGPEPPMEARLLLEQTYWRLKRNDALKKFYEDTLRQFPESVFWYNRAGSFASTIMDFAKAEKLFKYAWDKSNESGHIDPDAFDGYIGALINSNKLDKVFEETRKYVDTDIAPFAFYRMAEAKMKLGDKAEAAKYCWKALDKVGTNAGKANNILRRISYLLGGNEVQKYCEQKLQVMPDSFVANFAMFNLAAAESKYNKAIEHIDKCIEIIGPDDSFVINYIVKKASTLERAYAKTSDKKYLTRAVVEFESLLTKMPNNITVLNNLAYMLAENDEQLDKALKYAERVHEAQPDSAAFLDTYAYVLHKNGKNTKASEILQAAIQQFDLQAGSISWEVYEHLGMVKEALKADNEAVAAYEQALKIGGEEIPQVAKQRMQDAVERVLKHK